VSKLDEVLDALAASGGAGAALATVVGVRGSTYRREGARLVVPAEGETVGNISGGCLEGDVAVQAREVLAQGAPRLLRFDLTADDEAVWGWGLGCNGAVDVLVEPAGPAAGVAAALRAAREEERPLALVTVIDGERSGARMVVQPGGGVEGTLGDAALDDDARAAALDALARRRSRRLDLAGGVPAFVEVLEPPLRLVVCGAGHDAVPLVEFAARLGWRVDVVDDRPVFLVPERFPQARRFVEAKPAEAAEATAPDADTCVVVMSHNFLRDRDYLRSFLPSPAAYLGMLGPRARLERLLAELDTEGVHPSAETLARVHGPAGLDIGAEGPEEIAWSIVAEILAVRRRAAGGFLRDRRGPIHAEAVGAR
jgi:xanthine/CO dehydrogenase XdhC/CoxF family maturation factor